MKAILIGIVGMGIASSRVLHAQGDSGKELRKPSGKTPADLDKNNNGIPDWQEVDVNKNGIPDFYEGDNNDDGIPDWMQADDNDNDVPDWLEGDLDKDGKPDWQEVDLNQNNVPDYKEKPAQGQAQTQKTTATVSQTTVKTTGGK